MSVFNQIQGDYFTVSGRIKKEIIVWASAETFMSFLQETPSKRKFNGKKCLNKTIIIPMH